MSDGSAFSIDSATTFTDSPSPKETLKPKTLTCSSSSNNEDGKMVEVEVPRMTYVDPNLSVESSNYLDRSRHVSNDTTASMSNTVSELSDEPSGRFDEVCLLAVFGFHFNELHSKCSTYVLMW